MSLQDIKDNTDWLVARESLLLTGLDSNHVPRFIQKIIWNIESIEVVLAWDTMSPPDKKNFHQIMAPIADPISFSNAKQHEELSANKKLKAIEALIKKFSGCHDTVQNCKCMHAFFGSG